MGKPGTKHDRLTGAALADAPDAVERIRCLVAAGRTPEDALVLETTPEHRQRLGQHFTPEPIAELMLDWIAARAPRRILDPAVGGGVFLRLAEARAIGRERWGLDIDPLALAAASEALPGATLVQQDFLRWPADSTFDAIIANPPYLRHHDFHDDGMVRRIGAASGMRLSRLSNIYVLFVVEICRRLREGGRAAVIVPAEWMNANFGHPLRSWLLDRGLLKTLIAFSNASTQFDGVLTTASILLIEKGGAAGDGIRTAYVEAGDPLQAVRAVVLGESGEPSELLVRRVSNDDLRATAKWSPLLQEDRAPPVAGLVPLSALATTRRGIATGANDFFHVSPSQASAAGLRQSRLRPCIGRAADVSGLVFSPADHDALRRDDRRVLLVDLRDPLSPAEERYVRQGEARALHERYLCAARGSRWFAMERRPVAPIWAAVFGRSELRFVLNSAGVANLTTFHCIYPATTRRLMDAALTACLNSAFVQARSRTHRRIYGGGLLKFEPKDLLSLEVPDLRLVSDGTLLDLAKALERQNAAMRNGEPRGAAEELNERVLQAVTEAASATSAPPPRPAQGGLPLA